jgi:acetyl esterase/lipase
MTGLDCVTLVYKQLANAPFHLDVYPPSSLFASNLDKHLIPAVIYFHGGGLTVGNRQSWFPAWLHGMSSCMFVAHRLMCILGCD